MIKSQKLPGDKTPSGCRGGKEGRIDRRGSCRWTKASTGPDGGMDASWVEGGQREQ